MPCNTSAIRELQAVLAEMERDRPDGGPDLSRWQEEYQAVSKRIARLREIDASFIHSHAVLGDGTTIVVYHRTELEKAAFDQMAASDRARYILEKAKKLAWTQNPK